MRIIRDYRATPENMRGAAIAIGSFDGLHRGHQALLNAVKAAAKQRASPAGVVTFEPHPREFFRPDLPPLRLYSLAEKLAHLRDAGMGAVWLVRFNAAFAGISAHGFMHDVLGKYIKPSRVFTGGDFTFGHKREGDAEYLQKHAQDAGFAYNAVPPLMSHDEKYASSAARAHLQAGEPEKAAEILGRPYAITGRVRHGDARGRTLGYPTANLSLGGRLPPRYGIYAVRAQVDGRTLFGVANIGIRPMFETRAPLLEAHWFDFKGDLYGRKLTVALLHYIREEQKFDSIDALRDAMAKDCIRARMLLESGA